MLNSCLSAKIIVVIYFYYCYWIFDTSLLDLI